MGLDKYLKKRNFAETSEPKGGKHKGKELRFVVQRHHASRLHYDFRLEMEGVLKSWAVPKGPSLFPKDKRLAMMVEDHPYDYRTFEGEIPEGNYGAGYVTIFDEGTYESLEDKGEKPLLAGLAEGNLKFRLNGKILKGEFALVKLKSAEDNSWLLIKHNDEHASKTPFDAEKLVSAAIKKKGLAVKEHQSETPKKVIRQTTVKEPKAKEQPEYKPMLAKLAAHVFDDLDWIYEKKLDGYRAIAYTGDTIRLISRNGLQYQHTYTGVVKELEKISTDAVLDGELVIEDQQGKSLFQELQNYNSSNKRLSLKYYVFDLLYLNGHDLTDLPLLKRKELLKTLIESSKLKNVVYVEHTSEQGAALFKQAEAEEWEGIIAKDSQSTYENGKRSDRWQKFKLQRSQEAIICGFTAPAGSRQYFGSLVLSMLHADELVYIGNVGTGFNEETLKDLHTRMKKLETGKKPFSAKVKQEKTVTWIAPELICEVTFTEWTNDKQLRHPVYKGLRMDKEKKSVVQETPVDENSKKENAVSGAKARGKKAKPEPTVNRDKLKLTNLEKLYWKKEGITKGQLLDYYEQVSPYLLPYLKDRPLSLNRHPNGIEGPSFFQKDMDTEQIPKWLKTVPVHSESNNKEIDYLICNDPETLLYAVNLGCIEINPWLSTYKKPDNPDFLVIDLDPQDIDFKYVIEAALVTRDLLEQMGIKSYVKTSGSRGMHIFVHVGKKHDYDLIKMYAEYLAKQIHAKLPKTTSIERSPSKRRNLIYLDYLQNRRGQTIAAPFSARPKPGATVSTTLDWSEVNDRLDFKKFTIFNTLDRLQTIGDQWKDIFDETVDLKKALQQLKQQA